MKLLKEL